MSNNELKVNTYLMQLPPINPKVENSKLPNDNDLLIDN